jgi:hypothetical protein
VIDLGSPVAATSVIPGRGSSVIDLLLRDRELVLARIRAGDVAPILRASIATIAIAMAVVGAAIGTYRGGEQIAYAAIKLPLVLLGTAALSAPVLTAFGAALGRPARLATDLAIVMSALAYGALLACAGTPLVLLGRAMDLSYHQMTLVLVALFGITGIASLRIVITAIASPATRFPGWRTAVAGLGLVFVLVGGQLSWALRPYLVRPRSPEVVFLRDPEGSLIDAITRAAHSARGVYFRERAPMPEHWP